MDGQDYSSKVVEAGSARFHLTGGEPGVATPATWVLAHGLW